mgnify:CR=1 FL=1
MSKHSLANNRFIKDMPIEHDMHRDGPKNMNKGYGQEVPGGPPMYDKDKGGPPMHDEFTRKNNIKHGGPKNYDTDKGSHAHPHDGPKKYGAMKGDQSKTRKDYSMDKGGTDKGYKGKDGSSKGDQSATKKDYESGGPGMYKGKKKKKY